MGVTKFSGPVVGALQVIPAMTYSLVGTNTYAWSYSPPAGMTFEIVDIYAACVVVTSDPAITVGLTKAATDIVASVNLTTNLGSLTLKTNSVTSGDVLDVRLTSDNGDGAEGVSVTITGYVTAAPTTYTNRGRS